MRASAASIEELLRLKYGPVDQQSWGPRLRAKFDYITPDDEYEALLLDLVCPATEWLDVGCGRNIIHCKAAAEQLAARCRRLVGIDPSENILENTLVHERAQCMLEDYRTEQPFDLITLKMVAEHITDPEGAVGAMRRLLRGGGRVVIYTVWKWAPVSIIAATTPMWVHHRAKAVLFGSAERDSFPVAYRMNTRRELESLFSANGFREESFRYLDDCRSLQRWRFANAAELTLRRGLNALGLRYPETCILATYRLP